MAHKSVGIMTFHWAANYGAVLQAWALQDYLMSLGVAAELIDYVPQGYKASLGRCFKAKRPSRIIAYFQEYRKEKYLEMFRKKHLYRTSACYTAKEQLVSNPPQFDLYISGSDQIWNPYYTMKGQKGVTLSYYLDFAPVGAKRISFSSSFGLSHIPDEMKELIAPELRKFGKISVREKTGVDILMSMGISASLTADPTLLLSADSYKGFISKKEKKRELFFYCLHGQRKDAIRTVRAYAESENLTLTEDCCKGIEDWLQQIHEAEFVITNSFHGVVFCILFHVPFVAFEKKEKGMEMGGRLTTLLRSIGLEEHFCSLDKLAAQLQNLKNKRIDWNAVDHSVELIRENSQSYLHEALNIPVIKTVNQIDNRKCTGCGLCEVVCPVGCISMVEDEMGFWYPKVDAERCVQCGMCYRECIAVNQPRASNFETTAYACYHKDDVIRYKSSSGGAFTAVAQSFLAQGDVVVGAAFTQPMEVQHICIDDEHGLAQLRGSKYMASRSWTAYAAVKKLLQEGKKVLFSGTPCQVAAIKKYTNNHSDLFCIDVACHGVPSGSVLKAHCAEIEKKTGRPVKAINFRDKITGWRRYSYSYMDENGHVIKREEISKSTFGQAYVKNLILRSSCMNCPFACNQRQGDITLCDHWRIVHLGLDREDKGVSGVLINSEKGRQVFCDATEQMNVERITPEEVYAGNPVLCHPTGKNPSREGFFAAMQQYGYKATTKKYCVSPSLIKKVARRVRRLIK